MNPITIITDAGHHAAETILNAGMVVNVGITPDGVAWTLWRQVWRKSRKRIDLIKVYSGIESTLDAALRAAKEGIKV